MDKIYSACFYVEIHGISRVEKDNFMNGVVVEINSAPRGLLYCLTKGVSISCIFNCKSKPSSLN